MDTIQLIKMLEPPTGKVDIGPRHRRVQRNRRPVRDLLRPPLDRPGTDVKAIYAAPFWNGKSTGPLDGMEKSYDEILKIVEIGGQGRHHAERLQRLRRIPEGRKNAGRQPRYARPHRQSEKVHKRHPPLCRRDRRHNERRLRDNRRSRHHRQNRNSLARRKRPPHEPHPRIQYVSGRSRRENHLRLRRPPSYSSPAPALSTPSAPPVPNSTSGSPAKTPSPTTSPKTP